MLMIIIWKKIKMWKSLFLKIDERGNMFNAFIQIIFVFNELFY